MTPKNNELVYDMFSKSPSKKAKDTWAKIFASAKRDQDKILNKASKIK